jgi:DNA-binding NarL/FixJ family response regulator
MPNAFSSEILRILVADDQEAIRKRVRSILVSHGGFEVCAEATNGNEAIEKAQVLKPDLVILDITMPITNGLDAARTIKRILPQTPIVILSVHKDRQIMKEARGIGVQGFVAKEEASRDLINAAEAVLHEQTFFPFEA